MGDVIKAAFGRKTATQGPVVRSREFKCNDERLSPNDRQLAESMLVDVLFVRGDPGAIELIRRAVDIGDTATDHVFSLINFEKKDSNVETRRDALRGSSLEELCCMLINSNELMWNKQPHFIGAIVLEMNDRLSVVQECCPELEIPRFK